MGCKEIWKGYKKKPPCNTCFPGIHEYNIDAIKLFNTCDDQLIIGPAGAAGLNDVAIGHAMKAYFKIKKKDRLKLSLKVRSLSRKIIKLQSDKARQDG